MDSVGELQVRSSKHIARSSELSASLDDHNIKRCLFLSGEGTSPTRVACLSCLSRDWWHTFCILTGRSLGFCNIMAVLFTKDGLQKCRCLARGLVLPKHSLEKLMGPRSQPRSSTLPRSASHFGSNSRFENPGSARATCPSNKCFGRSGGPGQCDQIRVDCAGRPLMPEKRPPSMSDAVHCGFDWVAWEPILYELMMGTASNFDNGWKHLKSPSNKMENPKFGTWFTSPRLRVGNHVVFRTPCRNSFVRRLNRFEAFTTKDTRTILRVLLLLIRPLFSRN